MRDSGDSDRYCGSEMTLVERLRRYKNDEAAEAAADRIEELERVCAMALDEIDADGVYGLDHVATALRTVLGEKHGTI